MKPIINPWIFYLIDVLSSLKDAIIVICVISAMVSITCYIVKWCSEFISIDYEKRYGKEDNSYLKLKNIENKCGKIFKTSMIIFILTIVPCFAIPSKNTMYTMFVSSLATDKNIETITDTIKDSVDYIIEKTNNDD